MHYKRILGIDYGDVRVGLAQTDLLQMIASPLETIKNEDEEAFVKSLFMITSKPVLYSCNISEDDMMSGNLDNKYVKMVKEYAENENSGVVVVCAKLEEDLIALDDDDRAIFMEEYGRIWEKYEKV